MDIQSHGTEPSREHHRHGAGYRAARRTGCVARPCIAVCVARPRVAERRQACSAIFTVPWLSRREQRLCPNRHTHRAGIFPDHEPLRGSRTLQLSRRWNHEHNEEVLTQGAGASGSHGAGAPIRTWVAVGGDRDDRGNDRLYGEDAAGSGSPGGTCDAD